MNADFEGQHIASKRRVDGRDKRRVPPTPTDDEKAQPKLAFLSHISGGFKLQDVFSAKYHSQDFLEARARDIQLRLRFMVFFYAFAVPAWASVDYLILKPAHVVPMLVARVFLTAFLLLLGTFTLRTLTHRQVHIALALTIIGPSLFYVVSMLILDFGAPETAPTGYRLMPLLLIVMTGVLPLTLACGLLLIATVALAHIGLSIWQGTLTMLAMIDGLWMLLMFGGIALWIQVAQLLMLLRLYRESTRDPLTGLINRRVLMRRLISEIDQAHGRRRPFCILMFDLDRFKRINDDHGHLTGDEVLKTTATLLQEGLREHDLLARFGGEEFVAVLPGSTGEQAIKIAERIRKRCEETQVSAPDGRLIELSTSIGVTEFEDGETIERTLARVDDSLYKAKDLGRNRVVHSQSEQWPATRILTH